MTALALSLLAGLLTIFNPCVLPLAPILIAGANARDARAPVALALGLALTFGVVGGIVASLGLEIGESASIRFPAGILMLPIGLALMIPAVADWMAAAFRPLVAFGEALSARVPEAGLVGNAGLGALLALVWAPCIGPTMGAALVLATGSGTLARAMASMVLFAIGAATSLLIAGYGLRRLARAGRLTAHRSARTGKTLFGAVLVLIGIGAMTGWDHLVEAAIVEHMPDWFVMFATRY